MLKDLSINIGASIIYDAAKWGINQLSKTETVQVVLKKLGFSPALHDFPDRYVEALVEYKCSGKELVVMNFFREESIMNTFFLYYYGDKSQINNQKLFDESLTHYIEALKVGDEVKAANINIEAEIQIFWSIFKQKVHESRTVKEAEVLQKIEELSKQTQNTNELFHKLWTWLQQQGKEFLEKEGNDAIPINEETIQKRYEQNAQKLFNINTVGTLNYYEASDKENDNINMIHIWVISTTQNNYLSIKSKKLIKDIPHEHYHETNAAEWKPFKDNDSIKGFLAEYKNSVSFDITERFLGNDPLKKEEESWVFQNLRKIILIFDPLALTAENKTMLSHFNTHHIGGCLGLLCHCISFELFSYLRTEIETNLNRLQTCFLDYKDKYIHFMFPISTKEMFFRSLTNIAMVHIKVSTKIEGVEKRASLQNKSFKF